MDAIVYIFGIKDDLYKTVSSSVDKLDKEEWSTAKKELIERGITEEQSEKLWSFVQLKDKPKVLLEKLNTNNVSISNQKGKTVLKKWPFYLNI